MPSDAQRRRAILENLTPATRTPNGQYLTLRFARYPDGHYAYGSPADLQNCMNGRGALEIIADFTRLIAAWERKAKRREPEPVQPTTPPPPEPPSHWTVNLFHLGDDRGPFHSESFGTFKEAFDYVEEMSFRRPVEDFMRHVGFPRWDRYQIVRPDGSLAERGDPDGCRGAPALEVRLGRAPTAAEIAEDQRFGEDL